MPNVFADSRLLKLDTKQAANCDTVGAASPVSDSCNQRAANNVSNGVPTAAKPGTPGTLLVNLVCSFGSSPCRTAVIDITVTGNNPQPASFSFTGPGGSQLITLGVGSFTISRLGFSGVASVLPITSFSGDCLPIGPNDRIVTSQATGTMTGGQHLTCNIRVIFAI